MNPFHMFFLDQISIQDFAGQVEPENYKGIYSEARPFINLLACEEEIYHTETVQVFRLRNVENLSLIMKRTVIDCPRDLNPLIERDENITKFFHNTISEFCIGKIASTHCSSIAPYFLYFTKLIDQNKLVSELFMENGGLPIYRYLESIHKLENGQEYIMRILCDSANILYYLESHKIAHNDIKISNFLIDSRGSNLKLIDYGISIWNPKDSQAENIMKPLGFSRNYASPEVLKLVQGTNLQNGETFFDFWKSDIYSYAIFAIFILSDLKESSKEFKDLRENNSPEKFTEKLINQLEEYKFHVDDKTSIKLKVLLKFCLAIDPSKRITFKELKHILFNIDDLSLPQITENLNSSISNKKEIYPTKSPPTFRVYKIQSIGEINIFSQFKIIKNERKYPIFSENKRKNTPKNIKISPCKSPGDRFTEKLIPYFYKTHCDSPTLSLKAELNASASSIKNIQESLKDFLLEMKFLFQKIKENELHFKNFIINQNRLAYLKIARKYYTSIGQEKVDLSENIKFVEENININKTREESIFKEQENPEVFNTNVVQSPSGLQDTNFIYDMQNYYNNANYNMNKICCILEDLQAFLNLKKIQLKKNFLETSKYISLLKEVIDQSNKNLKKFDLPLSIKDLKEIPIVLNNMIKSFKENSEQKDYLTLKLQNVSAFHEDIIKAITNQIETYVPFSNKLIQVNTENIYLDPYKSLVNKINKMILNIQNHSKIMHEREEEKEKEKLEKNMRFLISKEKEDQIQRKHQIKIENLKFQLNLNIKEPLNKENNMYFFEKFLEMKNNEKLVLQEINKILKNENNSWNFIKAKTITSLNEIPRLLFDLHLHEISSNLKIPEIKIDHSDISEQKIQSTNKSPKTNLDEISKIYLSCPNEINLNNQNSKNDLISINNRINKEPNQRNKKKEIGFKNLLTNPKKYNQIHVKICSENQKKWDFSNFKFRTQEELNDVLEMIKQSTQVKEVNLNISGEIQLNNQNFLNLVNSIKKHKSLQSITINCEKILSTNIYYIVAVAKQMPHFSKCEVFNGTFIPDNFLKTFPNSKFNKTQSTKELQKISWAQISK